MPNQWRKTKQNFESLIQNHNALGAVPESIGFYEKSEPQCAKISKSAAKFFICPGFCQAIYQHQ